VIPPPDTNVGKVVNVRNVSIPPFPIFPWLGFELCWVVPPVVFEYWKGLAPAGRLASTLPNSRLMNLFFLVAYGEAKMLAILCL
jgi:hypothetical protein